MKKIKVILLCCAFLWGCEKIFFSDEEISNTYVFEYFWKEIDRHFSFFEILNMDWDSVYNVYAPQVNNQMGESQLFAVMEDVILLLKDGHSNLYSPYGYSRYNYRPDYVPFNMLADWNHYLLQYNQLNNVLGYGVLKNTNIGYVYISTFGSVGKENLFEEIDDALYLLGNVNGIIIDVRNNGGGSSTNANIIASRFTDTTRYIFSNRYRNGPGHNDFTGWNDFYIEPHEGYRFLGPVCVLTNRYCYSSTEWFIAEMDRLPNVTIVGDTSGGGSGNPLIRELPNGWVMRVSNSQKRLPDGREYQYTGLLPDVPVWISESDSLAGVDAIIETAIDILSE